MEISTEALDMEIVADLFDPPQPRDHDSWHVSTLLNEWARMEPDKIRGFNGPINQGTLNIMAFGRLLEPTLRPIMAQRAGENGLDFVPSPKPKTVECTDSNGLKYGIIGTFDGLFQTLDGTPVSIVEIKSRHTAPHQLDPENKGDFRYLAQVMSYCYMVKVLDALMPVVSVLQGRPEIHLQTLKFTQEELDYNWHKLQVARTHYETRTKTNKEKP